MRVVGQVTALPDGSALFVADWGGHQILQVEAATGAVTTLAGSGTMGSADAVGGAAQFGYHAASPSAPMAALCL